MDFGSGFASRGFELNLRAVLSQPYQADGFSICGFSPSNQCQTIHECKANHAKAFEKSHVQDSTEQAKIS